ncbi:MAG: hypothetical protein IKJ68_06200 [Clostridia bacterium]|nr:hypothetical protein [Clostridia bacterium]
MLTEHEYVVFLVGKEGDFDQIVASAVKRAKRIYRDDNSSLTLCMPYPTEALNLNMQGYRAYYDEINVYNPDEKISPKTAHQSRNRNMVDRSDLVVFYVECEHGGTWQTMKYAINQKKKIINLVVK